MRRIGLGVALCTTTVVLAASGTAGAATTIGSSLGHSPSASDLNCNAGHQCTLIQPNLNPAFRAAGGLTAPFTGVISRFRVLSANSAPPVSFRVIQFLAPTGIGKGTVPSLPLVAGLNTLPARLPITVGDYLGVDCCKTSDHHQIAFGTGDGADTIPLWGNTSAGPLPDGGTGTPVDGTSFNGRELLINADIEADADQDGFGDDSQDKCVGTVGPYNGCPNTFTIGKPKAKGKKVTLTASVPGAGTLKAGSSSDASVATVAKSRAFLKPITKTLSSTSKQNVPLTLKLSKSGRKKLASKGKLKLKIKVVYTPSGGPPASNTAKAKLKK
jgi:hypothetical protein